MLLMELKDAFNLGH